MSLRAQAKVLRVLEASEVEPLGSGTTIRVTVRVLAATNKDLGEEMARNTFREDLFFRLNVVPVSVPSLDEHREDIPDLIEHFCNLFAMEYNLPPRGFSRDAVNELSRRVWKGNIRELKNYVERCLILHPRGTIEKEDLPNGETPLQEVTPSLHLTWKEYRRESEKAYLLAQLKANDWNVAETCRTIQIPRSHLYRLMESYKIERDDP